LCTRGAKWTGTIRNGAAEARDSCGGGGGACIAAEAAANDVDDAAAAAAAAVAKPAEARGIERLSKE
jgi:hypothetical protein